MFYYEDYFSIVVTIIIALFIALVFSFRKWIWIAALTLKRDIRAGYRYLKVQIFLRRCARNNDIVPKLFRKLVIKHPRKDCFVFDGKPWSFQQVENYSNRVANFFYSRGYKQNDVIGLFMENKPEFVCLWLGLSKIGVITSLINSNLHSSSLLHCIQVADCKALIFGSEVLSEVNSIKNSLSSEFNYYMLGKSESSFAILLDEKLLDTADTYICFKELTLRDNLLYIFTSGTTGLPKAAVIKHIRFIAIVRAIYNMHAFYTDDVIYDPLPLYHTAGGCLGVGQSLVHGCTVILRKKFSVSSYWRECALHKCTVAQYIGEMCRYLLSAPEAEYDRRHNVRLMFGNGIRPQIWERFQKRFGIKQIGEFYGATEGNANISIDICFRINFNLMYLVNIDNRIGSIGFVSRLFPFIYPISLIRVDEDTGFPLRYKNGLCVKCNPGEAGELVGKIETRDMFREFQGYADKAATEKKVIRDVFQKGDRAFLSGDILIMDELGYLYFKDRTGDTFRWRGENVATSEVESLISDALNLKDCVVYGVEIPGVEGRAGMAAMVDTDGEFDVKRFADTLKEVLPVYARPLFIRLVKQLNATGTYKLKKIDLQKEGFNPNKIQDSLFYLPRTGGYQILTPSLYELLISQEISL